MPLLLYFLCVDRLRKYSKHPDFSPEKVGEVSQACKSMCQWVLALDHYRDVYKMAAPKQKRVSEAMDALSLANKALSEKQENLQTVNYLITICQRYVFTT